MVLSATLSQVHATAATGQQPPSSGTQQALESLAETQDRSRSQSLKRKGAQIPTSGRNPRSESQKKTKVGLSLLQEYEMNKDNLTKLGMDAERHKKMETGLNMTEIVNKQKVFMKKYAEMEQLRDNKDDARKHAQK